MVEVRQTAEHVNSLLSSYIDVHNDCFGSSIRRIIPFPGIFKSIDFCSHQTTLSQISRQLHVCETEAATAITDQNQKISVATALLQYIKALDETVMHLHNMCRQLCAKSKGDNSYSMDEYNRDNEKYKNLVDAYTQCGEILNQAFHAR